MLQEAERASDAASRPAFVLDLDGTLVDSVYQHVMAWRKALTEVGIPFAVWQLHRLIGTSGELLVEAISRESGCEVSHDDSRTACDLHDTYYGEALETVAPLPGALDLLRHLTTEDYAWAIATSGSRSDALPMLNLLKLPVAEIHLLTSEEVPLAKPNPQLFLEAVEVLQQPRENTFILGDSVWDMLAARRAGCVGIGLMSGGLSRSELLEAHAFRVYADAADLMDHVDDLGIST